MKPVYSWNIVLVAIVAAALLVGWAALVRRVEAKGSAKDRAGLGIAQVLLAVASVVVILQYTVIGRTPSGEHVLVMFSGMSPAQDEFWREMFMNALLYLPFGAFCPFALDRLAERGPGRGRPAGSGRGVAPYVATIILALAITLSVETWQYLAGTGTAQGTDVICNTLGAAIGGLAYLRARK